MKGKLTPRTLGTEFIVGEWEGRLRGRRIFFTGKKKKWRREEEGIMASASKGGEES